MRELVNWGKKKAERTCLSYTNGDRMEAGLAFEASYCITRGCMIAWATRRTGGRNGARAWQSRHKKTGQRHPPTLRWLADYFFLDLFFSPMFSGWGGARTREVSTQAPTVARLDCCCRTSPVVLAATKPVVIFVARLQS